MSSVIIVYGGLALAMLRGALIHEIVAQRASRRWLEQFFAQQHRPLVNFLLGRGANSSDAEDAAQMVFMQVFARWATLHNPRAYLYQARGMRLPHSRGDSSVTWTGPCTGRAAKGDIRADVGLARHPI
ncbi:MAG: RNA polymerase sigma factor [Pseudonocardiaceae bacterium]